MSWKMELRQDLRGVGVFGADGDKVGTVSAVYPGYIIVEKGFFFPTDYYIPMSAVASYDTDGSISTSRRMRPSVAGGMSGRLIWRRRRWGPRLRPPTRSPEPTASRRGGERRDPHPGHGRGADRDRAAAGSWRGAHRERCGRPRSAP